MKNQAHFGGLFSKITLRGDLKWEFNLEKEISRKRIKSALPVPFELMFHMERFFTFYVLQTSVMFHVGNTGQSIPRLTFGTGIQPPQASRAGHLRRTWQVEIRSVPRGTLVHSVPRGTFLWKDREEFSVPRFDSTPFGEIVRCTKIRHCNRTLIHIILRPALRSPKN